MYTLLLSPRIYVCIHIQTHTRIYKHKHTYTHMHIYYCEVSAALPFFTHSQCRPNTLSKDIPIFTASQYQYAQQPRLLHRYPNIARSFIPTLTRLLLLTRALNSKFLFRVLFILHSFGAYTFSLRNETTHDSQSSPFLIHFPDAEDS